MDEGCSSFLSENLNIMGLFQTLLRSIEFAVKTTSSMFKWKLKPEEPEEKK